MNSLTTNRPSAMLYVLLVLVCSLPSLAAQDYVQRAIGKRLTIPAGAAEQFEGTDRDPESVRTIHDRYTARPLTREEQRMYKGMFFSGDGGGSDIQNLQVAQFAYLNSDCEIPVQCRRVCNAMSVLWLEATPNPLGTVIFINGEEFATVEGLAEEALPAVNGIVVGDLDAGDYQVQAEELNAGGFGEGNLKVINDQPFDDPSNLTCETGFEGAGGTCQISMDWQNLGVPPDQYFVALDGAILAQIPVGPPGLAINDATPGNRCVGLNGIMANEDGIYQGCWVQSCCTLTCNDLGCAPPAGLQLIQTHYSTSTSSGTNGLRMEWVNGEAAYEALFVTLDSVDVFQFEDPATAGLYLFGFPAEPGRIGISGACGATRGAVESNFNVFNRSPITDPLTGDIACFIDEDTGFAEISWENNINVEFIFGWIDRDPNDLSAPVAPDMILSGRTESLSMPAWAEGSTLRLQFFAYLENPEVEGDFLAYGSEVLSCVPEFPPPPGDTAFIRGLCNGVGERPAINSAIFGLNHLFVGGQEPPCREACDVNADGAFNLTDMVQLLLFLFRSGMPPAMWMDSDGDGIADPTCEALPVDGDCATLNPQCAA